MKLMFKSSLAILAVLLLGLLAMVIHPPVHFQGYGVSDWVQWADSLGKHPGTRFAPDFSEAQFAQIKTGMTREEVQRIAGNPLQRVPCALIPYESSGENWSYAESVTNIPNFHLRDVDFNSRGRVIYVWKAFYTEGQGGF